MPDELVPSMQLRWLVTVPKATRWKPVYRPTQHLQQWWHRPNEAHNSATDLNGEWRNIEAKFVEGPH